MYVRVYHYPHTQHFPQKTQKDKINNASCTVLSQSVLKIKIHNYVRTY